MWQSRLQRRRGLLAVVAASVVLVASAAGAQERGDLQVDPPIDGAVALYDADGELVAEVEKASGAPLELGLEPGPYIVLVRDGLEVLRAEVEVVSGEATVLVASALRPLGVELEGAAAAPVAEAVGGEGAQSRWDLGLWLGGGESRSALPDHAPLQLQTLGVELRVGSVAAQVRGRFASTAWWEEDEGGPAELSWGGDLGLLAHWAPWSWLALRVGARAGVDVAFREVATREHGFDLDGAEETWLVVRGGPVAQVIWRPLGWLGVYGESSADLFFDGEVVPSGQLGLAFYLD